MNELTITGELLKKLRLLKNMSQDEMAIALGISQPRYFKIECKKTVEGELLARLMEILDYTSTDIEKMKRALTPPENDLAAGL